MLVGWHLITEWMDPDGEKWLSESAHKDSTAWQRMGYLSASLTTERENWEASE